METVVRKFWQNTDRRAYDRLELFFDAIIHLAGLGIAIYAAVLIFSQYGNGVTHIQTTTMALVLIASFAFNQCPPIPMKDLLSRIDQATIFLFIAGTYTSFLLVVEDSFHIRLLLWAVWSVSLIGVVLKLFAPNRFGRVAILLYLAMGWSGALVISDLSSSLPGSAMEMLVIGGFIYSVGIVFHVWESLRFHNALWHLCVVAGATLHLLAAMEVLKTNLHP